MAHHAEKGIDERVKSVDGHHGDQPEDMLSVINRVTTAHTQPEEPRRSEVFEVHSVAAPPPRISNAKRNIIICLVVCANLISVRRCFLPHTEYDG